jgi:hypothetical protein
MSPEQALGRGVDTRSDNYALGIVAYEMLTGRLPFTDDNPMALLVAHMQQQPTPASVINPGIPPELDQLVMGLLAKDPAHRPTLTQVMGVLGYFRESGHPSGVPTAPHQAQTVYANAAQQKSHSTLGHASGQQANPSAVTQPSGGGKMKLILAGVGVIAVAGVAIAMLAGGGGKKESGGASNPTGSQTTVEATPADAAVQVAPPVDATSVVEAPPVDAAVPVAAPIDAATAVATTTTTTTTPKKPPKVPKKPKDPVTTTTTTKPPPDDDDGLIRVTPKK